MSKFNLLSLFSIVFVILSIYSFGQNEKKGIQFIEQHSLKAAIDSAAKVNRLVFVDCYTTWCGPCKMLSAKTFTNSAVGEFFNDKFVSVKLDMEKVENIEVGKKYSVRAFPTLLFINPFTGKLEHQFVGYCEPQMLLKIGETALDTATNFAAMNKQIESGNYTANELKTYLVSCRYFDQKNVTIKDYLEKQDPKILFTLDELLFFDDYSGSRWDSDILDFVWKNHDKYIAAVGQKSFNDIFVGALDHSIMASKDKPGEIEKMEKYGANIVDLLKIKQSIRKQERLIYSEKTRIEAWKIYFELTDNYLKNEMNAGIESVFSNLSTQISFDSANFNRVKALIINEKFENGKLFSEMGNLNRLHNQARRNLPLDNSVLSEVSTNIEKYEFKPAVMLNNIAWSCFLNETNNQTLNYALVLSEQAVKSDKSENNLDTYALIYAKLGQFDKAIEIENEALEVAKNNNNNEMVSTTNKQIAKLKLGVVPGLPDAK